MKLPEIRRQLRAGARPDDAIFLAGFFKTGPGEYGAGDRFLGIRVPTVRRVARLTDSLSLEAVLKLLHSPYHEERLLALIILVRRFERGNEPIRQAIVELYLANTAFINNWDLVDLSAPNIIGQWLLNRPRDLLQRLVKSKSLWERRIAMLATLSLIRQGQFEATLSLCQTLLGDPHDLMHKACGWMLREVGKRDSQTLRSFLDAHAPSMPRTMLRYALEKFPETVRKHYLLLPRQPVAAA